jgi:RNA polymerase sigma-70 factor, ECF subfamily
MENFEQQSDGDLCRLIAHSDHRALVEVYRRHGASVHNLARRVCGSEEFAEEVTQDVFLDLWKRPQRFDADRGSLRTYLITRAHGLSVDLVRAEVARQAREQKSVADTVNTGYDFDHYVFDLSTADKVQRIVAQLPHDERAAIEMAYFEGMTYSDVAKTLGTPEGTIKSRIRSGLRRLREVLHQQEAHQQEAHQP